MTDGWPLYESRLKGKFHVISKRYTQRIERHNLNLRQHLRQHLARLGRKSLSFSKSVELHDNKSLSINWDHYQYSIIFWYRLKRLFGGSLTLHYYNGQVPEAIAMVRALNKMTKAGMPESVRIARETALPGGKSPQI